MQAARSGREAGTAGGFDASPPSVAPGQVSPTGPPARPEGARLQARSRAPTRRRSRGQRRSRAHRGPLVGAALVALLLPVAACSSAADPAGGVTGATDSAPSDPRPSDPTRPGTPDAQAPTENASAGGQTATGGRDAESVGGIPTAGRLAAARAEVSRLSLPRLAAQLVVPRQSGDRATAAAALRTTGYGGYAVFRDNLPAGAAAVPAAEADNRAFTQAVAASGRSWPAFISIDQEGGPVTRLDAPLTQFPAVMALGAADDAALARRVGAASGAELRGLGYTVVLAPVADVTIGVGDPTIGVRSAGSDPRRVARVATGLAAGYADAGILSTLKHFPGHGGVTADTHVGTVVQNASLARLRQRDLLPFQRAAQAGAPAVMTAHIVLRAVDADRPTTVSARVLTGVLREQLGFRGLIVTDALEMAAVAERFGPDKAAVEATRAGADVLLMPADPKAAVDALVSAVGDGTLTRSRLEESAARMVATLRAAVHEPPAPSAPGSHDSVAAQLAAASITQLTGRCGARLVGSGIAISGGEGDRAALTRAAKAAGLRTGSGTSVVLRGGSTYRAAEGGDSASGSGGSGGALRGDVVVGLDAPYALAQDTARVAKLATFGRTPATYSGLVDVLLGKRTAGGTLPVAVGDKGVGAGCGRSK